MTAHHPPHILVDDSWYFVTGSTVQRLPVLQSDDYKRLFVKLLFEFANRFSVRVFAWVVLDDHYHVLLHCKDGRQLPDFVRSLHGRSAFEINGGEDTRGRQVWQNYWDKLIEDEKSYWTCVN